MKHAYRMIGRGPGALAHHGSRPLRLLGVALLALVVGSVLLTSVQSLWSVNLVISGEVQTREVRSQLTPTQVECADFRDGTAADQDYVQYGVKDGKIDELGYIIEANPGVFFLFTRAAITSTAGTADQVSIDQSITALREIEIKDVSVYYDPSCQVQSRPNSNDGATDSVFEIGETGDFIIRVRYNSQSLKGTIVCPGLPTSTHTFATSIDGVQTTQDSLDVMPKPSESCASASGLAEFSAPAPGLVPGPIETSAPSPEETPGPTETSAPSPEETPGPTDTIAPSPEATPGPTETPVPSPEATPGPTETPAPGTE